MINLSKQVVLVVGLVALAACAKTAAPDTAADETAVRAVNIAWFKAYNAGDGAAVAALYSEDAVLSAPGAPPARGKTAISEFYVKDAAAFAAAGLTNVDSPTSDFGMSGNLAWQWGTYKITDKSGAAVDAGKYTTLFQRKDGKWMIIRDTWNSNAAPATAPASAAASEPSKEMRAKMASAHEQTAVCLRSEKSMAECHKEMMKSHHDLMGEHGCPMMGMQPH